MTSKPLAFIHGAYQTKFGELWRMSFEDLLMEAAEATMKQAGVSLAQIDAIYIGSMLHTWVMGQNNLPGLVASTLKTNLPVYPVEMACASGGLAFHQAVQALGSGRYQQVLVLGVEKMTDLDSATIAECLMGAASWTERQAGLTFPGLYGLMQRAYQTKYGLSDEQLARVPVKAHQRSAGNPKAHFNSPVSVDQVISSDMVADPIRLLHASGVSDGAAGLVLGRRAGGLAQVLACEYATDTLALHERSELTSLKATKLASARAYGIAHISADDVDLWEVHDCFSIAGIIALEDLGVAMPGEGHKAFTKLPVNTSGGLKACGHPVGATGVKQIVSLAEQLSAGTGKPQAKSGSVGVAQNVAGSGSAVVVSVLGSV